LEKSGWGRLANDAKAAIAQASNQRDLGLIHDAYMHALAEKQCATPQELACKARSMLDVMRATRERKFQLRSQQQWLAEDRP
jgi:hypothetical protein